MPPAKRRRVTSTKTFTSSAPATRSIIPFTKVNKTEVLLASNTKKSVLGTETNAIHNVTNNRSQSKETEGSKRKLAEVEDDKVEDGSSLQT
jgi:hypothetical protein